MPMMPFAPPRLSTITCCPKLSDIFCTMMRPARSMPPPAKDPITSRMGRVGYDCASADAHIDARAHASTHADPAFAPSLQNVDLYRSIFRGLIVSRLHILASPHVQARAAFPRTSRQIAFGPGTLVAARDRCSHGPEFSNAPAAHRHLGSGRLERCHLPRDRAGALRGTRHARDRGQPRA